MMSFHNWHRPAAVFCLSACLFAGAAQAQIFSEFDATQWREGEVPKPPAPSTKNMVQIDMPPYSSLLVGVDVDSVSVTPNDGVVRYVTLLQGPDGTLSAYYQGVHCQKFTGRTYARYRFDANPPAWEDVETEWQELRESKTRYANITARAGACENFVSASDTATARRNYAKNSKWTGKRF